MGEIMNHEQFTEYLKKNGITKIRTTEDFKGIPKGTILFFGNGDNIRDPGVSTYDRVTEDKNKSFGYDFSYDWWNYWKTDYKGSFDIIDYIEETPSKNVVKMTKKTIYNVLIVDKKTGKTTKDEKVTANNEQQAILKTFGVDAENTFIKITELGTYEEDKPIKAVIETVEEPKK